MTVDQQDEHRYRYEERLGVLCGADKPTPEQERIARMEADQIVNALKLSQEETQATKSENRL